MPLSFTKMQGAGNDYVYVDGFRHDLPADLPAVARRISDRRYGVGGDGLICILPPEAGIKAHVRMRMFNNDGSESEMCGNGIRCVAEWLRSHDAAFAAADELRIDTLSGPRTLRWQGPGLWQVEMGRYSAQAAALPAVHMGEGPLLGVALEAAGQSWTVSCISVGNPHCVVPVQDVDALDLAAIGPAFERHPHFPEGVNTEFVQQLDATHLKMRVWERGSGETWACGTGACASAAAARRWGLAGDRVPVAMPGGRVEVALGPGEDDPVRLRGPATYVAEVVLGVSPWR